MKIDTVKQRRSLSKDAAKRQYGALCYRIHKGNLQILLVTTRGTGRWLIPKGWPINRLGPAGTAEREAFEEAGVIGKVKKSKLGKFTDHQGLSRRQIVVYPLKVKDLLDEFPEAGQRRRKWLLPKKAAKRVSNPELAMMIREFRPKQARKA